MCVQIFSFPKLIYYQLEHQPRPPKRDGCHSMCKHCKQWWSLVSVINPALTRGTPQLEIISKPRASNESEKREAMIGWGEDEKNAQGKREPGIGLVKCWSNEDQHQGHERSEGEPVENRKWGIGNSKLDTFADFLNHPI